MDRAPTYGLTWMAAGVLPSYWDCQTPPQWFTFGSNHPGIVNFAFCDGSVRSITTVRATDPIANPPASPADPPAAAAANSPALDRLPANGRHPGRHGSGFVATGPAG